MSVVSLVKGFIQRIIIFRAGRSDEAKAHYLRKLGCKVGKKTRFIGGVPFLGTEPYL